MYFDVLLFVISWERILKAVRRRIGCFFYTSNIVKNTCFVLALFWSKDAILVHSRFYYTISIQSNSFHLSQKSSINFGKIYHCCGGTSKIDVKICVESSVSAHLSVCLCRCEHVNVMNVFENQWTWNEFHQSWAVYVDSLHCRAHERIGVSASVDLS